MSSLSASLPPLLLIASIVAATLLAGALPTLLLASLPGLTWLRVPGLLAALLIGTLPTLLLAALLMTLLVAILLHDPISFESKMYVPMPLQREQGNVYATVTRTVS